MTNSASRSVGLLFYLIIWLYWSKWTDDDLQYFKGSRLLGLSVASGDSNCISSSMFLWNNKIFFKKLAYPELWLSTHYMEMYKINVGHIKWKSTFEQVQNAQIQIMSVCKVSYRPLLSIHFTVSNDSVSEQRRPRSDCANAQSDLGLCCPFTT